MGNWFGKDHKGVHPLDDEEQRKTTASSRSSSSSSSNSSNVRIKVRMTVRQLKELEAQVDMSKSSNNSELGRLILQHCLEGKVSFSPIVDVRGRRKTARGCRLSTILEENSTIDG